MTRSDLVEELAARFGQLTHRDAEYAVKTWCADTASSCEALARSRSTVALPEWVVTPVRARAWPFLKSMYRTSSRARPCAKLWTHAPGN